MHRKTIAFAASFAPGSYRWVRRPHAIVHLGLIAGTLMALPGFAAAQLSTNAGQPLPTGAVPGAATGGNSSPDQLQGVPVVPTQGGELKPARPLRNAAINLEQVAKAPRARRSVTTPGLVYGPLPAGVLQQTPAIAAGTSATTRTGTGGEFAAPSETQPLPMQTTMSTVAVSGESSFEQPTTELMVGSQPSISALAFVDPALINALPPSSSFGGSMFATSDGSFVNPAPIATNDSSVPSWLQTPASQTAEPTLPVLTNSSLESPAAMQPLATTQPAVDTTSLIPGGLPATPVNPALDDPKEVVVVAPPVMTPINSLPAPTANVPEVPALVGPQTTVLPATAIETPAPISAMAGAEVAPAVTAVQPTLASAERRVAVIDLSDPQPEPLAQGQTRAAAIEIGPKPTVPAQTELRTPAVADLSGMPINKDVPATEVKPLPQVPAGLDSIERIEKQTKPEAEPLKPEAAPVKSDAMPAPMPTTVPAMSEPTATPAPAPSAIVQAPATDVNLTPELASKAIADLQAKIRQNEQAPAEVPLQPVSTILPGESSTAIPELPPADAPLKSAKEALASKLEPLPSLPVEPLPTPEVAPAVQNGTEAAKESVLDPINATLDVPGAAPAVAGGSGKSPASSTVPASNAAELGRPQPIDLKVLNLTGSPGMVQWQVNGEAGWQIPLANDEVKGRFVIRTGPDAGCELMVDSATRIRLGRLSRAEIRASVESDESGTSKRTVIVLLRGVVYITPPPGTNATSMPVLVKTPQTSLAITEPSQIVHDNAGTRKVNFTPEGQPAASAPTP